MFAPYALSNVLLLFWDVLVNIALKKKTYKKNIEYSFEGSYVAINYSVYSISFYIIAVFPDKVIVDRPTLQIFS